MNNLQDATERICELKGSQVALDTLSVALLQTMPPSLRRQLQDRLSACAEVARTSMLNTDISEHTIAAFETDIHRMSTLLQALQRPDPVLQAAAPAPPERPVVESLLLAAPRVSTFIGNRALTGASGLFFERDEQLYLVTSRHVLIDVPSQHFPDRVEVELHVDERDLSRSVTLSLPLYQAGRAQWRQATDSGGEIDVAALPIEHNLLQGFRPHAFTPQHLGPLGEVEIGTPLLVVGFPLGFHDGVHHLPVARQASVASSFGTRFQGQGLFLTDARTHRGTSGAPVVMRCAPGSVPAGGLPWKLLGIHSARMDMGGRDQVADESLGLNCAWYADILLTLTS